MSMMLGKEMSIMPMKWMSATLADVRGLEQLGVPCQFFLSFVSQALTTYIS
jgi:hypothetical protein